MKKILIVDDEPEVCGLIEAVLKTEGFKTNTAYGGKEALKKIKEDGYNLVLLDIMMPDLSGEEVLRLIRKTGEKLPVIFVTVKPKDEVDLKHVNGFIQKPFKNEHLVTVVKRLCA